MKEAIKKQEKVKSVTQYSQYSNDQYSQSYNDEKFETKSQKSEMLAGQKRRKSKIIADGDLNG